MPRILKGGQRRYRLDELEVPDLEQIPAKARRKIMRQAAKAVALKVREIAPDSGVRHKGKLKKSIRYQVLQAGMMGQVAAKAPHSHLVHDGTSPHKTVAKREGGVLTWIARDGTRRFARGSAPHPGARAQPFLVDAAQQTWPEVERILEEGVEAAIQEVVG